ncbi:hypothetical protein ERN12_03370 [Rhodobacteraceae bacterium]|nr:hypothetical protein ERN12_03370 [Paracoccaceae bacterium]
MTRAIAGALVFASVAGGAQAKDGAPISAIDWLSHSVVTPAALPAPRNPALEKGQHALPGGSRPVMRPMAGEPPVSAGYGIAPIVLRSLDAPDVNQIGMLPAARAGLPRDLWGNTPELVLIDRLQREDLGSLPAIRALMQTLLLSELDPPRVPSPDPHKTLFLARVDKLLDLGALEPARALLDQVHTPDAPIFRRRFDVALLLGEETAACKTMENAPDVAPTFAARIFCLARNGDWNAAALSLQTGEALGQFDAETATLLARFLEPELSEDAEDLPPPARITPLNFRMMEAIGRSLPTTNLPLAFAHADLRANIGWKAQIEAAERLAQNGAIDANQLLGLYTERKAAASGGVWDRVSVVSALDRAITARDTAAVDTLLVQAYNAMEEQELEPVLATLYGAQLEKMDLSGRASSTALRLGLLSDAYEDVAKTRSPETPDQALWFAIAKGDTGKVEAKDQLGLALKDVFDAPDSNTPEDYREMMPDEMGLAILQAMEDVTEGARGDYRRMIGGMKMLRLVGLEDTARRTALEMLLLERRG